MGPMGVHFDRWRRLRLETPLREFTRPEMAKDVFEEVEVFRAQHAPSALRHEDPQLLGGGDDKVVELVGGLGASLASGPAVERVDPPPILFSVTGHS